MKEIIIEGRSYPCFITMGAMLFYKEETGEETSSIKSDEVSKLLIFLYCTVKAACMRKRVEFPYTSQEFASMLDPETLLEWEQSVRADSPEENGQKKSPRKSRNS